MQRHGHHHVGVSQQRRSAIAHQPAEPRRNRSSPLVLQRVNDLLHPPFVAIDRRRPVDCVAGAEAQVQSRRQAERPPAVFADGAVERMDQRLLTGRARRLEQRREKNVGETTPNPEIRRGSRCPRGDRGRRNRGRAWRRRGPRSRSSRAGSTRRGRSPPPATGVGVGP